MWGLLMISNVAMLIVSICIAYWEERHDKRWWVSFLAGGLFFGSIQQIGIEIIRWLNR